MYVCMYVCIGVEQELDPLLTPILEKQIVSKGKSKYITVGGKVCDYSDGSYSIHTYIHT